MIHRLEDRLVRRDLVVAVPGVYVDHTGELTWVQRAWVAVLADAVQARLTTAARLRSTLDARQRVPRRAFLASVLDDVAAGTCSVLEHGYLDRVERPHGLPRARRQATTASRGSLYRDVDLDRDLAAAVGGRATVRLGWGQVFGRPCVTAHRIGVLLARRGWSGASILCPRCATTSAQYPGATG